MKTIAPGSTIGILGGGQLGRMLCIAAAQLGYRTHIYAPEPSGPASDVSARWTQGDFGDRAALRAWARAVDVATYEFENVDAEPLTEVAGRVALFPPLASLRVAQDRIVEKRFAESHGGRTACWSGISERDGLEAAIEELGAPAILKTVRFGYDGKGQARLAGANDADAAWRDIGARPAILEKMVAFDHEFSILLARGQDGAVAIWDAPENVHVDGILATSTLPAAPVIAAQIDEARALATRIAEALDHVGVITLEFFAGADGPVFNEMAPRVHNSGHWTIEGSVTSQFENHVRAICGLPLGPTGCRATGIRMRNLIGDAVDDWPALFAEPGAHVHLYSKATRPARKMGHVTRLL